MPLIRLVVSAAPDEGRGHLTRALALIDALVEGGAATELELRRGELSSTERHRLADAGSVVVGAGRPVADDVAAVVLDLPDPSLVVVGSDPERSIVFDDRDAFAGTAAVVVQPSRPDWAGTGIAGRVLSGYRYAPVAGVYRRLRASLASKPPGETAEPPRLVVCFGGSDPADVMGRIGPTLAEDRRWVAELVVGIGYRGSPAARATQLVRDPADLPERIAVADLLLIGAGTMKFEVACLGRPAILLAVADDQLVVGPPFAATGAAVYLGDGRTIDPALVLAEVTRLLADLPRRTALARAARDLVDGDGARRVAEAVLAVAAGAAS